MLERFPGAPMRADLALMLVANIMEWDDATATSEFEYLELMASYKYDFYTGYQSGSRFYLSLIGWLSQFPSIEERKSAYDFLKNKLIYISVREMHHLVALMTPIHDRLIRESVATDNGVPFYRTWTDQKYQGLVVELRRKTLFIALSDGARIDMFRRYNEGLVSNEQVLAASEVSEEKWQDMICELRKDLSDDSAGFERVCLVDDFTGSGSSLIRYDDTEGKWKGKLKRFYEQYQGRFPSDALRVPVCVHHHLASSSAKSYVIENLNKYSSEVGHKFSFSPTFSYVLPDSIRINDASESDLVGLIKKYYDKGIEDKHTGKNIWFGYKQSGLPLVLEHNTPNNSLAILWAQSGKTPQGHSMKPLFVRRKRHSSNE